MKKIVLIVIMLILGIECYLYFRNNKQENNANSTLNGPLIKELGTIFHSDQMYRLRLDSILRVFGQDSDPFRDLLNKMKTADSLNLIRVKSIIDHHGWLGQEVIGQEGNQTLFLVIQHADQQTQEKYLPVMKKAVRAGKAAPSDLALLEDRVLLAKGKKQIYGSQIARNDQTVPATYSVSPLEDPDNVDKRRAAVGLPSLSEYLSYWNITWDCEKYKKDLLAQEAKQKSAISPKEK